MAEAEICRDSQGATVGGPQARNTGRDRVSRPVTLKRAFVGVSGLAAGRCLARANGFGQGERRL